MKLLKTITVIAFAVAITITAGCLDALPVLAGSSDVVIDNTSFETKLDATKWNAPNGDVLVEEGKILFPKESTGDTRLIATDAITKSEYHNELLRTSYTMKFNNLPKGEQFMAAFGLSGIESYYSENGSMEVIFENKNGIKLSVKVYDDNGEVQNLVDNASCGITMGSPFTLKATISTDNVLNLVVNNKTIINKKVPIDLTGRVGFLQTGSCGVEISAVEIVSHRYDRPENINITEDFEKGTINVNTLTSKMTLSCGYYPSGIQVEEYNGSKVLMFRNANIGYFGTTHEYSNFEMTFDVPYMLRTNILREDGTLQMPIHAGFAVALGDESEDYDVSGYETATDAIIFTDTSVYSLKYSEAKADITDLKLGNAKANEGYAVKISVIDSKVTVWVKSLGASTYQEVLTYHVGTVTPLGYVHIWSTGQANFAIDNFSIVNKDKDGKVTEAEYREGFVTGTEDWKYEKQETTYLKDATAQNEFRWEMLLAYAGVIGVVILVGCVVIAKIKKNPKRKEGSK